MNLHEYQAKELFRSYGLPVSTGVVISSPNQAAAAIEKIGGSKWVVKAQVHAGGRGKSGGVQLVTSVVAAEEFAKKWLGKRLVTYQTSADGQPVNQVLIETCTDIANELYLGAVIDRSSRRVVFMASTEGGVEIEKVADATPEKIFKQAIHPTSGPLDYQGRQMAFELGLQGVQIKQFNDIFMKLARLFLEKDLALLEINPLVITSAGNLHCLDAKVALDANAGYRQQAIAAQYDDCQDDPRESNAAKWELNYVALDGNIGCMVNGAGLAMATMDTIKLQGGHPANFLDVGGGATSERVAEAFKIILSDGNVRAVLINIFGGIVRCDLIADGIVAAMKQIEIQVPVIVRLEGNNAAKGMKILDASGFNVAVADSLSAASAKAVAAIA